MILLFSVIHAYNIHTIFEMIAASVCWNCEKTCVCCVPRQMKRTWRKGVGYSLCILCDFIVYVCTIMFVQ